ncbi:MAG: PKD domain-containing protein [Lewinella sp.]
MSFHLRTTAFLLFTLLFFTNSLFAQDSCVDAGTGSGTYDGLSFEDRPAGNYPAGISVEICFSLDNQFQTPDQEWVHAILITSVGPGFDFASMMPSAVGPPAACRAAGNWAWYPMWSRCQSCGPLTTFFNGYAFDSTEGTNESCGDPGVLDGDPGNNFGDGPGDCGLEFCWTFMTLDPGGVPAADAYAFEIQVLADGVSGGYSGNNGGFCGSPCSGDPTICFPEIPDPEFTIINEPCPGDLFQLQGGPITTGVNPVWTDNADGSVVGNTWAVSLPEGSYTFSISKPGCAPKDLDVLADLVIPTLDYVGPDDNTYLCFGDPLDLSITVSGATVNSIQWTLNGSPVSNTDAYSVAAVTTADAGAYAVNVNYGDNCDTMIVVNVDVSPEILADITPANASVCIFQEITFTATAPGGGPFPPEYELSWDFGASTTDTYTFEAFATGPQTVTLTITDNTNPLIPCTMDFIHAYTVNELPGITIDPLSSNICFGDMTTLTAIPSGGMPPYTYLWGPDNIETSQFYTVAPPYTMELENIFVTVRDANGCEEFSFFAEVNLNTPPAQPTLSCTPICVSELEFSWTVGTADFYHIFASINGAPEVLIDDNYLTNSYLFTGLNAGDEVDFRVVPFSGDAMMSCEGLEASRQCETPLTSTPGFVVSYDNPICIDNGNTNVDVSVWAGEEGTFLFTSTTLGLADEPADADSITTIMLPAIPAGTNTIVHDLDIHYDGVGGRCPSDTSVQITVTQAPPAAFTLDETEICGFTGVFTASINTAVTGADVYTMQLEDTGIGGTITDDGMGVFTITIDSVGTHNIFLSTANAANPGCVDTFRAQITLTEPSPAPQLVCGAVGLDFVTFSWNDTGADSYIVNEVSIPAGGVVTRNGNSVTVNNLSVDDVVTISVTAVSAGCPDVTSEEETCIAESCPDITINIDDIGPFCEDDDQDITMTITAMGSDGSGILTWTIDNAPFDGTINPATLGEGTYSIRALLDEGCDFVDVFQLVVNAVPSSVFDLPDGPICTDTEILGAVAGAAQVGFTYQWTADGATVTPGADEASRTFSWSAPGRYFVSLQVTNEFNCLGEVYTDSIDVIAPYLQPIITCLDDQMESVLFSWDDQPAVDSFQVIVNGGAPFFQDSTTLFVDGLSVNEMVTIEVLPIGNTPCVVLPGSGSCTTQACPALMLEQPADMDLCEMEDDPRTLLTANVTGDNGMGTLTFSGPGVIQVGTDFFFDTDTAGIGVHQLTVDFVEGMCTGQQMFSYTVLEKPTSEFEVNGLTSGIEVCVGEVFTVEYTGSVTAGTVVSDTIIFCWDYPQNVPDPIDTIGFQTYTCSFAQPGPFRICLVVKQDGCPSDTTYVDGICLAPAPAPTVVCAEPTDLNSVTFSWDDVSNGEGFTIIRDGGVGVVTFDTEVTYSGLLPGEEVMLEVFANDSGPCGDGPSSGVVSCFADPCPILDADVSSIPDQLCILNGDEFISLSDLVVSGGTGNGIYSYSGTGVARDTFFAASVPHNETGTTYTITMDYEEEGPCPFSTTFDVTVFARPTAFITDPGAQCVGDTFQITVGSTNFVSNDDIVIDFDGGTVVPDNNPDDTQYLVVFDSPGSRIISADVISNISGCPSNTAFMTVEVFAPLANPVVNCINSQLESVTFDWDPVPGATGYLFTGQDGNIVSLTAAETEHTVSGLMPSQDFTGTVQVLGPDPCGNGAPIDVSCRTQDCPAGVVQSDTPPTAICLDGTESPLLLMASLTTGAFNGPVTWSGTGVVDNGDGTFSFDPSGLTANDYPLTVSYDGPSSCDSDDQVTITLNDPPAVTLTTTPAQLCVGQTMTVAFTGSAAPGASFDWNFGDADVTNLGGESYELSWPTPGTKPVSLVVTDDCVDSTRFTVVVDPTMEAPVPTCSRQDLDAVEFSWPAVAGATEYRYSTDGGMTFMMQTDTTLEFTGLDFGETVTLSIIALRTGTTCNSSPVSIAVGCSARTCPDITFAPAAAQTEFCDDEVTPVLLEDNVNGDDGTGVLSWSGPGVVDNAGTYSFDPTLVGLGVHRLYVTYTQEILCTYTDSLDVEVFAVPTVAFNTIPAQICQGEEWNVFFTGSAADGATYDWDFDGAVVTDLGNESYLLRWDTPGTKTVSLTVEDNCTATESFMIPVTPTLDAPTPTCARQDLDGVLFEWAAVTEATEGYRVSINGGPYSAPQAETSFFVADLDFGETVTINVISVRSGTTCDESSPSATVSCAARVCPDVTMNPSALQTVFCADETTVVALAANLAGHDGTSLPIWSGRGVVGNGGSFTFDPAVAGVGTHLVHVSYTQEGLCGYADSMEMIVNPIPLADFNQDNNVICSTGSLNVSLTGSVDPDAAYDWDFDGAAAVDNGNQSYDLQWSAGGTYDISLTVTRNGCVATSMRSIIVDEPSSSGTAVAGVLEICAGATDLVELSSRITGATPGGTWSVVSGGIANGSLDAATGRFNPAGLAAGDYRFAYAIQGSSCPTVRTEVDVNLLGAPVANAGQTQTLTCAMGMVSLNGTGSEQGPGYTYLWTGPNASVPIVDADQLMIDVGQPGIYQLQVTNAIGCTSISEVTVTAETEAPVMELEISQITCFASDNGAISVSNVSGGRPPYTYRVNGEDRGRSTLFAGLAPGEYDVQITDANGCFSNILLDLTEPDELIVRLRFPGDSTTANAGEDVFITASINGGNAIDTLIWQPDSLVTEGEGRNGISFVASETMMISVTVIDELGCSATDNQMLLVRRDRPVYFPTAFSPNGDNINDIFFIGGDLDQIDFIEDFFIYDRWGEAVYTGVQSSGGNTGGGIGNPDPTADGGTQFLPNDPAFGWDGMLNGAPMNPQVLVYTATVHFSDGEVIVYKGDFVLMR